MTGIPAAGALRAVGAWLAPLLVLTLTALGPGYVPARGRGDGAPRLSTLPTPVYAAHRGGAEEAPENSMAALRAAYRGRTAQVLDVDLRALRDGTLVAMHDRTLDRTTGHAGPVSALTPREWRRVRLRSGGRPPTADQILRRFGGHTVLNLELKDPRGLPRLARSIRERALTRSVVVQFHALAPAVRAHRMGLLTGVWRSAAQARTDRPERWRRVVDVLSVDHRARAADLRRAARSGIGRVWSHTIRTPAARDRVLRLGCDGVMTDTPRRLSRTPARTLAQAPARALPARSPQRAAPNRTAGRFTTGTSRAPRAAQSGSWDINARTPRREPAVTPHH